MMIRFIKIHALLVWLQKHEYPQNSFVMDESIKEWYAAHFAAENA